MKKYFILFLMLVLTNCYNTTSEGVRYISDSTAYSILFAVVVAPPIYVATIGVPGVTIGEAIGIGFAGGVGFLLLGIPIIVSFTECWEKSEDYNSFITCINVNPGK